MINYSRGKRKCFVVGIVLYRAFLATIWVSASIMAGDIHHNSQKGNDEQNKHLHWVKLMGMAQNEKNSESWPPKPSQAAHLTKCSHGVVFLLIWPQISSRIAMLVDDLPTPQLI